MKNAFLAYIAAAVLSVLASCETFDEWRETNDGRDFEAGKAPVEKYFAADLGEVVPLVEKGVLPPDLTLKGSWDVGGSVSYPDKTLLEHAFTDKRKTDEQKLSYAKKLLNKGARFDDARILWIAYRNMQMAANILGPCIEKGLQVNAKISFAHEKNVEPSKYASTLLHWASASSLIDLTKFLLAKNADPFAKTIDSGEFVDSKTKVKYEFLKGSTPFDWCRISPYGAAGLKLLNEHVAGRLKDDPRYHELVVSPRLKVVVVASSADPAHPLKHAFDGDPATYWKAKDEAREAWIEFSVSSDTLQGFSADFAVPEGNPSTVGGFLLDLSPLKSAKVVHQFAVEGPKAKGLKIAIWKLTGNYPNIMPVPKYVYKGNRIALTGQTVRDSGAKDNILEYRVGNEFYIESGKQWERNLSWKTIKVFLTGWNGEAASFGEIRFKEN